jgi:AcrR family transcriptional regulator
VIGGGGVARLQQRLRCTRRTAGGPPEAGRYPPAMSPPARTTARQSQGARSREEILDAAEQLMGSRGYAGTSISALAGASGLPPSSIYWHFGSKAGVLSAVMERGSKRFFAAGYPGPEDQALAPRERLRRLMELSSTSMRDHAQYLRLFVLLLLGVEGDDTQQDVITRVRDEGRQLLAAGLTWAYQPWGEAVAQDVCRHVSDLAQALLDGIFLAGEAAGGLPEDLLEQSVAALHAMAEQRHPTG